ncbi:PAS domain S-box protein [Methanoplanus sp. FWC-SCC4]|uniref:PAS domain S-box protein n=1 Tax=Methanochimaera problematica TaxID=2609417 RepID=A0AA97FC99_9EURY|nr:PAS domain S-box protein [Methanoplanus sp. FWC-SCC4]WOF16417.1 PAS domain S-box protein [Methanoplanus sp. FWC-SCC4]
MGTRSKNKNLLNNFFNFKYYKLAAVIVITAISFLASLFGILTDNSPLSHFLIIPVVLVSFLYPKRGLLFSSITGITFLFIFFIINHGTEGYIPRGILQITMIILAGSIISYITLKFEAAEEKYLKTINDQTEMIYSFRPGGVYTVVNNAFCEYYDVDKIKVEGHTFYPKMPTEDIKNIRSLLKSLDPQNPVKSIDHRIIRPDGSIRWVSCNIRAIFDDDNCVKEFQTVARDITDSMVLQDNLKDKINYVSALMDTIPAPVYYRDLSGTCRDCNSAFEKLSGLSKSDIVGKNLHEIFEPEMADCLIRYDEIVLADRKQQQYESEIINSDGNRHYFLFSKMPRVGTGKNVAGIIGTAFEITARKQAEEELKKSLNEKTILLNEVHHRVKNNLAILNSMIGMQMNGISEGYYYEKLNDTRNRIMSMALIHEELYKSDSISYINPDVHFNTLAKELISNFNMSKEIGFCIKTDGCLFDINTAIPCSIVVNELITNSIKYAFEERDFGNITIHMHSDNDFYYLKISDDGTGMPKDFDQNNTSTLGMKLVKNIIEYQLEGKITLLSEEGTTWDIEIPKSTE